MLIVFSSNQDLSTYTVLKWINNISPKTKYLKLNPFNINDLTINFGIDSKLNNTPIESITAIWYRRHEYYSPPALRNQEDYLSVQSILNNITQERKAISEYIQFILRDKYWLNHPSTIRLPKLIQLDVAISVGLEIPKTILTTSKKEIVQFSQSGTEMIIKPIDDALSLVFEDGFYFLSYTSMIDSSCINDQSEDIFPCIIQEKLDKLYEIRSFYIDGKFYSMAIFSQKGQERTKIDFRNEDVYNRSRRVPFNLPKVIENKLRKLMIKLNLNCGSFDIVRTKEGKYVFLEVNPVGQFGMVSTPCNYYLEKKIAEHLITKDNEERNIH